jgi:hypothetical protein
MSDVYARPKVNSPFIEGTSIQFVWDSTSLGWFRQCPKLYEYQMIQGYQPKGDNPHLKFGLVLHSALEMYDKLTIKGGWQREDAILEVVRHTLLETGSYREFPDEPKARFVPWHSDHTIKNRENLVRSVIWYLDHYEQDPAKVEVLANGMPAVELSFRFSIDKLAPNGEPYMLSGHLDKVVYFAESMYVQDKKTTGHPITDSFFNGFDLDDQMTIYTIAGKVVKGMPIRGIMIDGVHVAVGFTSFLRGFTYRQEAQLEEWLGDLNITLNQAETFANAGYWPRNTRSCNHYMDSKGFGGCPFKVVCKRHPSQRDSVLKTDFVQRRWNPIEARNVG